MTGLTVVAAVLYQESQLDEQIAEEMNARARCECSKIAKDVYLMLRVQEEGIEKRVRTNLNVAHAFVEQAGGVSFAKDTVAWNAVNQLTKQGRQAVLPKMLVGGTWLGQNRDSGKPSPVVDQLQSLLGGTCTIFQRMDESGDMLRVSHQRQAGRRFPRHRHLHPRHGSRTESPTPSSRPCSAAKRSSAGPSSSTPGT